MGHYNGSMIPTAIRAVVFDAVGTVIEPAPGAAEIYAEVGGRHGSRLTLAEIRQRFRSAFKREEEYDRRHGQRTSEEREQQRWRTIVAAVLDDVRDPEACFRELFDRFAQPSAWRCLSGVGKTLQALAEGGYQLALASNYDRRLRSVAAGLAELRPLSKLIISSEVGWRKPAAGFFTAVCRTLELPPEQIIHVGDDRENDFDGARAAGLHAILLVPAASQNDGQVIRSLDELLQVEATASGSWILFVYGTLKRGCRSHALLAGQEFLGVARTAPRYRLYRRQKYPCLVEAAEGLAIRGELWRVDAATLKRLDEYEGAPTLFARKPIVIEGRDEPVLAYFFNESTAELADCGGWKRPARPPRGSDLLNDGRAVSLFRY